MIKKKPALACIRRWVCIFFLIIIPSFLLFSGGARLDPSPPVYQFEINRDWLTMKDGVRLSVTYFKPIAKKEGEKFPVVFEFLPYRKDDMFYMRDYPLYTYFVRRGYVAAKVDIRGTGSSEGRVPPKEYSEAELNDAVEIIAQLSRMPWSNGKVGMWGVSWGGFNAIQVAMRRPPALETIMAGCATDDLFHDDVHYIDGAFHVDQYELSIDTDNGLPRWPDYALDEAYFEERFEAYPWFLTYLKHQRDSAFWRKNSLRWDYDAIQVPVYMFGGLLDGYRDSIPRMLSKMKVPLKAELGPYNHAWPDNAVPGPNYEWRNELVRWWDYWLKGRDTGIKDEPRFAVFVRAGHPPDAQLKMTPGYWRYEDWPIERTQWTRFYPADNHRLLTTSGEPSVDRLKYVPSYGIEAGYWWGEPTGDMRPADAGSLIYDSDVLTEKMEIIGFPRVRLNVCADAKLAHWIVRLEDVQPDGSVSLVTGALINGSQHESRLNPQELIPGKTYELQFPLHFTTWTFRPGHRIRLAVSNSLFPMIWPTPYSMTTQLLLGSDAASLELPVIPYLERPFPGFLSPQPREERPDARDLASPGWPFKNCVIQDISHSTTAVDWEGESRMEIDKRQYFSVERTSYQTDDSNPANSSFSGEGVRTIQLENRTLQLKAFISLYSDEKNFYVKFTRQIFEGDELIREKIWKETIPREFN
jgi:putative CocE/NonD family hydrolase